MQVYFTQIYIEEGVYFPFSHVFQRFISNTISEIVVPSHKFIAKYGRDCSLIFRISSKRSIQENELRGPTHFKKTPSVEYTIFLPFNAIMSEQHPPDAVLSYTIQGAYSVFEELEIDATKVRASERELIQTICADAAMFQDIQKLKQFNGTLSYLDERVWTGRSIDSALDGC